VWDVAAIILGCPACDRVSMSIYPAAGLEGTIEYGAEGGPFTRKTDSRSFPGKAPVLVTLTGLAGDTAYTYRLRYRKGGENEFRRSPDYHFHTCRAPGSAVTFEVQGDSHPERTPEQNDPELYAQTLAAAAKDRPDFYVCIGDDFSVDALAEVTADSVARVYLRHLPFLGLVGHSSPLFLVNGNHDQAALCNLDGTPDNVAVWARTSRNRLFLQPAPDGFYTGDGEEVEHIGLLRDYYAWTWGDALFVVIDPYWHSPEPVDTPFRGGRKSRDPWSATLGETQYKWLKQTLEGSKTKFKFVFAHHVNGTGRGGTEEADLYEWGGKNRAGDWEFDEKRPGWELPVHQLMARAGVTILFQGHDHVFAKQEKDGVVYQTLPQPADPFYALYNDDVYQSGVVLPNTGRLRVSVGPEKVRVEYVRSYLPKDSTAKHPDGEVAFTYEIPASK
jgi:hypothetical protein